MDSMTKKVQKEFLDVLFLGYRRLGFIELRLLTPGPKKKFRDSQFFKCTEDVVDWLEDNYDAINDAKKEVYFGVLPRITPYVSNKNNVIEGACLWADVDLKGITLSEALDKLTWQGNRMYPPSLIVHSGNGVHAYWRLSKPVKNTEQLELTVAGINNHVGGDNVQNRDRILRVPGTFNYKDPSTPKLVKVLSMKDHVYDFEDFSKFAEQAKLRPRGCTARIEPAVYDSRVMSLLPDNVKNYLQVGICGDKYNFFKNDRDRLDFWLCRRMLLLGLEKEVIASIMLNPDFVVSEKAHSMDDAVRYISNTINNAEAYNNRTED